MVRARQERGVAGPPVGVDHATATTTGHRAKGMEFSRVILSGADDKHAVAGLVAERSTRSAPRRCSESVHCSPSLKSRARDALVVTWSGKRTELLGAVE